MEFWLFTISLATSLLVIWVAVLTLAVISISLIHKKRIKAAFEARIKVIEALNMYYALQNAKGNLNTSEPQSEAERQALTALMKIIN